MEAIPIEGQRPFVWRKFHKKKVNRTNASPIYIEHVRRGHDKSTLGCLFLHILEPQMETLVVFLQKHGKDKRSMSYV